MISFSEFFLMVLHVYIHICLNDQLTQKTYNLCPKINAH